MVTSYYIMKMTKNKKSINPEEYYSGLQSVPRITVFNRKLKCRVCLQDGSILIFGIENHNIKEALKTFGDIEINEYDENPKHLCIVCYKFLKNAILFRKVAQRTNEALHEPLHLETPEYYEDHDYLETFEEYKSNENFRTQYTNQNSSNVDFAGLENYEENKAKSDKVQCPTCKKLFTKAYFKTHMTMHNPDHCNEYVCDICGKSFRLKGGYHNHRLRHRTDYIYKCQLCPFRGRYVDSLKSHMRTHTGNYRYMCSECPARFLFKGNLNHHILVKHKEPQYKCDSCDKAFHTELNLQRHIDVVHLGIKSHICNICGKPFGYRTAMMKHQRRVHKREKLKLRFNMSNYKVLNDD